MNNQLVIEIPVELIYLIVAFAVLFAVVLYHMVHADERDEDAILYKDMDGYARGVKEPAADHNTPCPKCKCKHKDIHYYEDVETLKLCSDCGHIFYKNPSASTDLKKELSKYFDL